jgi:hypothetical protein
MDEYEDGRGGGDLKVVDILQQMASWLDPGAAFPLAAFTIHITSRPRKSLTNTQKSESQAAQTKEKKTSWINEDI